MLELMRFFWQLALLRRNPQDLPGSVFLLQGLLLVNLLLGVALGIGLYGSPLRVLGASVLEIVLSGSLLYAGLYTQGKSARWRQAFSALLGIGIIGSLVVAVLHGVGLVFGVSDAMALLDLLVFGWLLVANSHVLRHSLAVGMPLAMAIVILYTMFLLALVAQWFPPELPAG